VCESHREELKADLFLASDGPRLSAERPTIFLGCRGGNRIHLDVNLPRGWPPFGQLGRRPRQSRDNPCNAIASLVDGKGRMKLDALKPPRISNAVRAALADVKIEPTADEPALAPIGARRDCRRQSGCLPGTRWKSWRCRQAVSTSRPTLFRGAPMPCCSFRFVVGTKYEEVIDAVRTHLHANGFPMVEVSGTQRFAASRTDFDSPWVNWTADSIGRPPERRPRSCRTSAARYRMTCFRKGWVYPRSGCRIPIPAARSMRRTNTFFCR